MTSRLALCALLLPAFAACQGEASRCEAAAEMEPTLELGVGQKQFQSVKDGDDLEVDWGNQGGRHIFVALKTEGVEPGRVGVGGNIPPPETHFSLVAEDGTIVANSWVKRPLNGDVESAEIAGIEMFVELYTAYSPTTAEPTPDLSNLLFSVSLTDNCGAELSDERSVTANGLL